VDGFVWDMSEGHAWPVVPAWLAAAAFFSLRAASWLRQVAFFPNSRWQLIPRCWPSWSVGNSQQCQCEGRFVTG